MKTTQNHQRINADSGSDDYYTPAAIIEAAREVMGGITLDPASSAKANRIIRATKIFTQKENGLARPWHGKVWMNHPFGKKTNRPWIAKIVSEYEALNLEAACCICFASTSEKWFTPLLKYPQCFIHGRTNYHLPDGSLKKGATKGSVVTYFGNNAMLFASVFKKFGTVKITL